MTSDIDNDLDATQGSEQEKKATVDEVPPSSPVEIHTDRNSTQAFLENGEKQIEAIREQFEEILTAKEDITPTKRALKQARKTCETRLEQLRTLAEDAEKAAWTAGEARDRAQADAKLVSAAKETSEVALHAAEEASGKAGVASQQVQDHATTVSKAKAEAVANADVISDTKTDVNESASRIAAADERIQATSSKVTQLAEEATAQTGQIEQQLASANNAIAEITQACETANEQRTNTVAKAAEASEAAEDARAFANQAETDADTVSSLTTTLKQAEDDVEAYRLELDHLKKEYGKLKKEIEGLLPGATSVGLAAAFADHTKRLTAPKWLWAGTFIGCIVGLLVVSWVGGGTELLTTTEHPTWDSLLTFLLRRIPFVAPLVWLAIYAGRQHMLTQRLEEDYAFKAATSRSFEGYKREMRQVSKHALGLLCDRVLGTVGSPPGRIYDGKHEDITPLRPVTEAIKCVAATRNDQQDMSQEDENSK